MMNQAVSRVVYRAPYRVLCQAVNGAPGWTMGRAVFWAVDEAVSQAMGQVVRQAVGDEPSVPGLMLYLTEMVR